MYYVAWSPLPFNAEEETFTSGAFRLMCTLLFELLYPDLSNALRNMYKKGGVGYCLALAYMLILSVPVHGFYFDKELEGAALWYFLLEVYIQFSLSLITHVKLQTY